MRFGLLGPLLVADAAGTVAVLPAAKHRVILAALLLSANATVSSGRMTEILWGVSPPPNGAAALRNYVMRLRRQTGSAGARIVTRPEGYAVEVRDPAEFDLAQAESMRRDAKAAAEAGRWPEASALLAAALSLWRGEPLADIPSPELAQREAAHLAELRLALTEARVDADLRLARHDELVAELRHLVASHPLREHVRAQLMIALYRCGRQAEALEVYRDTRAMLAAELGIEPGPELRELHQRILAGEPALVAAGQPAMAAGIPAAPAAGPQQVVPRQLPAAIRRFVGRAAELKALDALLDEPPDAAGRVVVSAISGTAGVGKTALAVQWAHRAVDRFPDGQLYVNLRGYDPGRPVAAEDALAGFLRALGVPGQDIPAGPDERAARYRSLLAGRRVLVLLDNAGSAEQVRPLLPGTPGCLAVVTSRDSMAGLVARDDAERLDLDLLPLADAVGLLRALIGPRVDADPGATAALAGLCARLPLALRVAAEFAAARPADSLTSLVGELADQRRRLDLLDAGRDDQTAVRAVFSWSGRHLDAVSARIFRLLGLAPVPDLDQYAVAALAGTTPEHADGVLAVLARAHLIQTAGPGRYVLHDLLRAYAGELTLAQDSQGERQAALTRMFDYYLQAAATAMAALFPAEQHVRPPAPELTSFLPPLASPARARNWLDAERAGLVAVAAHAAGNGWPGHATSLSATLFRYLDSAAYFPEALAIHGHAHDAARRAGDPAVEATTLISLGMVRYWQGGFRPAAACFQRALGLFREVDDQPGQARALNSLGLVELDEGRYQRASGHFEQSLALHRAAGDRAGEARALVNLGFVGGRQGRYHKASDHLEQAIVLYRDVGHPIGEARAQGNLGLIELQQGHCQQARYRIERSLALCRAAGDRLSQARGLSSLGEVDSRQGRHLQAVRHHRQSLALCREIGDRSGEVIALNGLGEALLAARKPGLARTEHVAALGLAAQIGYRYEQARAHNGLAHADQADGQLGQARRHWQQALSLYAGLSAPEADEIRARLTSLDSPGQPA